MKKIFIILLTLLTPIIAFGDLLPEPDILDIDDVSITDSIEQENSENTLNNSDDAPNILDIKNNNAEVNIPGQDDDNVINGDSNIYENEEVEDEDDDFDPLAWLYFGFCNQGLDDTTRSYNGAGVQGEPFKICAMIYNSSNRDITVQMDLTDAIVDENDGTNSCTLDYSFGEFLTSGTLGKFVVPAENYVIKEFEITFPLGFDGVQKGCLSYHAIYDDEDEEGIVITIRKGYYMDFFVGSVDIKNEITTSELATNLDDNGDLILSFWVNNIGNMENTFDIQGVVKGLFGYNKKFEATDGQLAPGKSQFVEINLGSLPSYGGKFDIDFTINGTPYFSYDISNANVDPARLEPKSRTFGTTYFKMPWLILAVVVIFILLLIVLFKKPKQKVVYVQQAQQAQQSQQPVQAQPVQQPTQQYTQPVQPSQPVQQPVQQPTQPVQQPQQPQNPNYPQN